MRQRQDICGPCSCHGEWEGHPFAKAVIWHDEPYCLKCATRHLADLAVERDDLTERIESLAGDIAEHQKAAAKQEMT